jgi:hypothetical protein
MEKLKPMRVVMIKDGVEPHFVTLKQAKENPSYSHVRDKVLKVINSCENITHTVVAGKMINNYEARNEGQYELCWELKDVLYAKNRAIINIPRRKELEREMAVKQGRARPLDRDIFPNFQ